MRLLVLGRDGQLGWELQRSLQVLGEVAAAGREDCDLGHPAALRALVERTRPDVVVNAAAYTAVDRAETEPSQAAAINAAAPTALAGILRDRGGLLIHFSTDFVFDGSKADAYDERDEPCPVSAYGRSKRAGEQGVMASGCDHLILRTSWLYGPRGRNFMTTILGLAGEREELQVVGDQHGAPTTARLVADASAHAIGHAQRQRAAGSFQSRLLHLTAAGSISRHGFAEAIVSGWRARGGVLRVERIREIATVAYPALAQRPRNSRLACATFEAWCGLTLPPWTAGLALSLDSLVEEAGRPRR